MPGTQGPQGMGGVQGPRGPVGITVRTGNLLVNGMLTVNKIIVTG